jgi:hypothetical protein
MRACRSATPCQSHIHRLLCTTTAVGARGARSALMLAAISPCWCERVTERIAAPCARITLPRCLPTSAATPAREAQNDNVSAAACGSGAVPGPAQNLQYLTTQRPNAVKACGYGGNGGQSGRCHPGHQSVSVAARAWYDNVQLCALLLPEQRISEQMMPLVERVQNATL